LSRNTRRTAYAGALAAATAVILAGSAAHAITGGDSATDTTDTFVAKLQIGDIRSCTGVLVAPRWLLTSASCFADGTNPVTTGAPPMPTTATVGRTDLSATGGRVTSVIRIVPRTDRDVVLAELLAPVNNAAPARLATAVPTAGEVVKAAGFGRTATEWAPNQLHTAALTVTAADATTVSLTPNSTGAAICKGDAGGPLMSTTGGSTTVVAINTASWQHGCLDADPDETRNGAVGTRVDDLAGWVATTTLRQDSDFVDFDDDGRPDMLGVSTDGNSLMFYANTSTAGNPSQAAGVLVSTGWGPIKRYWLTDYDGDGKVDIVGLIGNDEMAVWRNTSTPGHPSVADLVSLGTSWKTLTGFVLGDFTGDGKVDIAGWTAGTRTDLWIIPNTSTPGSPLRGQSIDYSNGWQTVTDVWATDYDGDGLTDLVGVDTGHNVMTWRNTAANGTPSFTGFTGLGNSTLTRLVFGDFTGDGKVDIGGWTAGTRTDFWIIPNTSTPGSPSRGQSIDYSNGWQTVTNAWATDYDGDGLTDLVGIDTGHSVMTWRNTSTNGTPSFTGFIGLTNGLTSIGTILSTR
jgi:hypothetical protein